MTAFLIKIAGANYRTTITGCAEALAATFFGLAVAPYTLGDVSTIIDPSWKPFLFKAAGICYIVSKVLNSIWSKASNVSGNGAEGMRVAKDNEFVTVIPPKETPKP